MRRLGRHEIDVAPGEERPVLVEVAAVRFDGVGGGTPLDAQHLEKRVNVLLG